MFLCILSLLVSAASTVQGQCAITNAAISLSPELQLLRLLDRDDFMVVIEGITTGAQATVVTWRRNGLVVDRNTVVAGGSLFDGGGETVVGTGPCESQMYRIALQVTGFLPGSYSYSASNANTPTPVSSQTFVIQDPGPPTNLVLTQISNRRVQATWTAPAGFPGASYRVFINNADTNTGGHVVTGTTYTTAGPLAFGFPVAFRVRASAGTYYSVPAVSSTLTIIGIQPPVISVSSVTATSATLSFSQSTTDYLSVDTYTATLTTTTCPGVPTRTESTSTNSITIGNLEAGIQYSVSVTATNSTQNISSTATTTLTTSEASPSGTPGIPVAGTITPTSISITWTEVDCLERNGGISGYRIQYGEGTNRDITVNTQSNTATHTITGLAPFTQYTFTVAGINSVNTGPFSNASELIRTAENSGPPGVRNLNREANLLSVVLTWDPPEPLNGVLMYYTIQYSVNGTSQRPQTGVFNVFTISNLHPNTIISNIAVFATTGGGDGLSVMTDNITTLDVPAMVQDIVTEVVTDTSVRVSWNYTRFQDITGFVIYYRQTGNRVEMTVTVPFSSSSVVITGLVSGREYTFEVAARALVGGDSVFGVRSSVTSSLVTIIAPTASNPSESSAGGVIIVAVLSVVITVTVYSIIVVTIGIIICFVYKRRTSDDKKFPEVTMNECPAYGQVSADEVHYDTVKL